MLYAATKEKVANHQRAGGVPERGSSVSRTHGQLLESLTGHLSEDEFEFFQSWDRLIDLEADAEYSQIADCWLEDSANREIATSKTISSLEFDASRSSDDTVLDATTVAIAFKRSSSSSRQTPLQSLGIEPGSHVVISLDTTTVACSENSRRQSHQKLQMHLVRGFLDKCLDDEVTVRATFDDLVRIRKYAERYGSRSCHFRIDRDDVATGVGTLRQNLVNLLVSESTKEKGDVTSRKTRRAQWLREVIVKLRIPVFAVTNPLFRAANTGLHFVIPGCDMKQLELEFESLNVDQKAAVVKVMTAMDYSLIQGLPGTGKTSTIAFIARLLVAHGKRVLITSYTHAAVDNVLLKLIDNGVAQTDSFRATPALIRVGLEMCCHPGVHHILASTVAKELEGGSFDDPSADYLRRSVQGARVVGITALSIPRSPLLLNEDFDVVIVDEAGQISQPAVIGALLAADSFVLVGDHMQLPPLVKSALAEKGGKCREEVFSSYMYM